MRKVLAILLMLATPAAAHDWYDRSCCDNRDCFQAPESTIIVRVKGGYRVTLPGRPMIFFSDSAVKASRDRFYHPCIIGTDTPMCLYVPLTG